MATKKELLEILEFVMPYLPGVNEVLREERAEYEKHLARIYAITDPGQAYLDMVFTADKLDDDHDV